MSARTFLPGLAFLVLAACSREEHTSLPVDTATLPVRVAVVSKENLPIFVEAPATVRPAERATIAAKVTGSVASFPLGLGGTVNAGDVLVTLNVPEAEARVRQVGAQLAEAERNADRARTLSEKGVNSPDSLRDAEDRLRYARAASAESEALLAYTVIRAPFEGTLTEKFVLPGDLATPGLPLLVLESTRHLRAEGTIPERAAAALHLGDPLTVRLDDASGSVQGHIEEMSAAADAVSRSVLVKVALPAGSSRSGQFVRLLVADGSSDAFLVPTGAVTRFGQMERVFVVDQGQTVLRLVKTGRILGERIEVLSGLNPGEQVVLAPPLALREGQAVTISSP